MAVSSSQRLFLQPYPREGQTLLSADFLYPKKEFPISINDLEDTIDKAFSRCFKNKKGESRIYFETPESLVKLTLKHLKERSDPILNPYFFLDC